MSETAAQARAISPHSFIEKWKAAELKERAAAQSHFNDLCRLLGEPTPIEADPKGEWYAFEKGAMKTGGGDGWADVWKRGHFAWEYKGRHGDLDKAFAQLQRYAIALENPPLLIVSDMERFRIHTNWTNTVQNVIEIELEELADARRRQPLKWAFTDPAQLKPGKTRQELTEEIAGKFARLALHLRERGNEPQRVAHFVNRLVFCMFAEDVGLLPNNMFKRMLEHALFEVDQFEELARGLFAAMGKGGRVGFERVEWFNGSLFDSDDTLPLTREDIALVLDAARLDWSNIDPSIMGTLFERGLDPDKRSQLGAHYTDRDKIMLIVNPVIVEPLTREWEEARNKIEALMERVRTHKDKGQRTRAFDEAQGLHRSFIERLKTFRVLDPACGSGNFLYLALLALKDLEHRANLDVEMLGLPREFPSVGPECVKGIEINPFAAELARVSVWIGEIQWMKRNGFDAARNPILKPLETIECRDALLNEEGSEADWPKADVIIGNPPFLGAYRMLNVLSESYVAKLRDVYHQRIPGAGDLVTYWFEKAAHRVQAGQSNRAGLVATNSIRGGASRVTLDKIVSGGRIFSAWADEAWVVEGAAVRVSLVCFDAAEAATAILDGKEVGRIRSDLMGGDIDFGMSRRLAANASISFLGTKKGGPFDQSGERAREMLLAPFNPNGRPNADVLKLRFTGGDLARRTTDRWVIDFGHSISEADAQLYQVPFEHVRRYVKPVRDKNRRPWRRDNYWLHSETAPGLRNAIAELSRFIATPRVAKYRLFAWLPVASSLDDGAIAVARDDDTTFGILHSRFHELWTLRMCTWLGKGNDPRYTPTTCFETFPFPHGLTPDIPAANYADDPRAQAIAEAARNLDKLREAWLNPPDLVERVPEVVPSYPDRIVPRDDKAAAIGLLPVSWTPR